MQSQLFQAYQLQNYNNYKKYSCVLLSLSSSVGRIGRALLSAPRESFCSKKEEQRGGTEADTSHSLSPAKSTAPSLPERAEAEQSYCMYPPQGSCRCKEATWVAFVLVHGHLKPNVKAQQKKVLSISLSLLLQGQGKDCQAKALNRAAERTKERRRARSPAPALVCQNISVPLFPVLSSIIEIGDFEIHFLHQYCKRVLGSCPSLSHQLSF